jgi:deoxyhypusine synthase
MRDVTKEKEVVPHRAPGSSASRARLSGRPIRYYRPQGSADVRHLIDEGFQAFNAARIGEACRIFTDKMLAKSHDTTIALTVAGALTPAGLGGCVIELMERGLVDVVISTGANLYHDLHYALNFTLHRGSPFVDDRELYKGGIIRIYDVLFPAQVLLDTDLFVRDFLVQSGLNGPISTADLHEALGHYLLKTRPGCEEYSVVARAALVEALKNEAQAKLKRQHASAARRAKRAAKGSTHAKGATRAKTR